MHFSTIFFQDVSKASKLLLRDYHEIEQIHHDLSRKVGRFIERATTRTKEIMTKELEQQYRIVFLDDMPHEVRNTPTIYVNPIEGIANFGCALPFFGVVAILEQNNEPYSAIITLPAFGETYFATKNKGAWRFTSTSIYETRLIVTSRDLGIVITDNHDSKVKATMVIPSCAFGVSMIAAAKANCFYSSKIDIITAKAAQLIIQEAKGFVKYEKNKFIASNSPQMINAVQAGMA